MSVFVCANCNAVNTQEDKCSKCGGVDLVQGRVIHWSRPAAENEKEHFKGSDQSLSGKRIPYRIACKTSDEPISQLAQSIYHSPAMVAVTCPSCRALMQAVIDAEPKNENPD